MSNTWDKFNAKAVEAVAWVMDNWFLSITFLVAFVALILAIIGLFARDTPWAAVVLGFVLALLGNWAIEGIKRFHKRRDDEKFIANACDWLCWEIQEGIGRCQHLINITTPGTGSPSRLYVDFWNLVRERLAATVKDRELVALLGRIYYRFDLINFNMEGGRFGVGGEFAKWHIAEIQENFEKLKSRIGYRHL